MGDRANLPQSVRRARLARIGILVALNLVLWSFLFARPGGALPHQYGDAGTIDFIQYWTAHALMARGENPYDRAATSILDHQLGRTGSDEFVTWNPPWLMLMLAPILHLPFITSASIWLVLGLVLAAATGVCTTLAYRDKLVLSPAIVIATFAFQPIASNLWFGQMGLVHALSIAGFLCALTRQRKVLAGLALVPLTIKPHLAYLIWVLLGYWSVRTRTWRPAAGFIGGFAALVLVTWLAYPASIEQWIESLRRPPTHFVVASLVGVVRELAFKLTGELAMWPMIAIPAATAVALVAWLVMRRPAVELRIWLPPVLALSLFTSPYGWVFDQCQLLVLQVGLVALADRAEVSKRSRRRIWLSLAAVQLWIIVLHTLGRRDFQDFFWVGLALAAAWVSGLRELRVTPAFPG